MFKQISFVTIFLLATFNAVLSQDLIKNYPGIPIVTYSYDILKYYPNYNLEYHLKNMDSAGIFAVEVANMQSNYYTPLNLTNLKIIPDQAEGVTNNYINRYTEAHYSVWEAEGTDSADGDASVYYDSTIATKDAEGTAVVTKTNMGVQNKKLIYGPYYLQENTYCMVEDGTPIDYQADFILKKETIGPPPNPNDTMCVLQVTTSHKKVTSFDFDSTIVIKDTAIIYSDIADSYKTFSLHYDLTTVPDSFLAKKMEIKQDSFYRGFTDYVEFRVIWKGNSNNVRLYVDKIILSDFRGRFLTDPQTFPIARQQIGDQIDDFQNRVVGWMGIDEPQSIDNYEPIRIVQGIIDLLTNGTKGLWIAFGGGWSGRWDNYANPWGTYRLSYFEEFYKRVKKANIWCSKYLYDVSYPRSVDNYREKNISAMADSNYRHFQNKENVFWGAAIQTGEYYSDTSWITMREIDGTDLLYNINIALLYGAKVITPWLYFGRGPGATGLVNTNTDPFEYTDKWYKLKNTIAPRLRGLLGKTLKSLTPKSQYAGLSGFDLLYNTNVNKEYISEIRSLEVITEADNCFVDLGFFNDSFDSDKKYFMIVNRYYSTHSWLHVHLQDLSNFINWELTDYVDTTRTTLCVDIDGNTSFDDTISIGDAKLYSILPVVKYGGKLIADESVGEGMTLIDAMSIEAGATLSVYGEYNANADITIKPGGKIVSGDNGKIIFSNGHQLIIEGIAQINGSASNRLEIVFDGQNTGGIKIKPNGTLKAFYCNIIGVNNAKNGITSDSPTKSVTIENVSITGFKEYGISLQGAFGEGIPDITPSIKNCLITNCEYGTLIANFNEFVISGNTITDCKLGINIAHIPAVFVVGNNITYSSNPELWGIFMLSSNGNIRGNTVRGHTNGIYLGYSSPNIGGNILEHNSEHGLFVDIGSVPNLVRGLTGPLPLVIAVSGYNVIKENGIEGFGPMNGDGSEIFLRESYIYMNEGCNQIIDDQGEPENFLLMNGSTSDGSEIKAEYNYWGTTEPNNHRFGDLVVYFDPFNPSPYYTGPCTTPQSTCEEVAERTSKGELVDMIAVKNCEVQQLTELEQKYAEAQMHDLSGEMDESRIAYQQIVGGQSTPEEKLIAYNKLYAIGNLIDTTNNYFTELQNIFSNLSQSISDSVLKAVFRQNEILCKVSKEEYTAAINDFDNIIQQNPQSEEAVFAEMDILTTALLVDTVGGQLGKMAGGKYMVKGSSDYHSKLNDIMRKNFGKGSKGKENIIPTEYSLSQNYPNPFNPVTKIKYQIPNTAQVSLKVYDILGREVATLVNEEKPAGYYEVNFDVKNLSSGCYFYRIITKDFVKTMKMIAIK